jgi:hypothetical protein
LSAVVDESRTGAQVSRTLIASDPESVVTQLDGRWSVLESASDFYEGNRVRMNQNALQPRIDEADAAKFERETADLFKCFRDCWWNLPVCPRRNRASGITAASISMDPKVVRLLPSPRLSPTDDSANCLQPMALLGRIEPALANGAIGIATRSLGRLNFYLVLSTAPPPHARSTHDPPITMLTFTTHLRPLCTPTLACVLLAVANHAQQVTVSSPTKASDEGVTVKVDDNGQNVTLSNFTGIQGTKPAQKADDLPIGMDAKDKAIRIAAAINAAADNFREDGSQRVTATANGANVDVAGTSSKVKVEKIKVNSNTGETSDKLSYPPKSTLFTSTLLGIPAMVDGCGDAAIFRIGTARGVVEVPLASAGSVHQALLMAADGLAQHGIAAWLPTPNSIAFVVDADLDEGAHYGCSDFGLEQVAELEVLPSDGAADASD